MEHLQYLERSKVGTNIIDCPFGKHNATNSAALNVVYLGLYTVRSEMPSDLKVYILGFNAIDAALQGAY